MTEFSVPEATERQLGHAAALLDQQSFVPATDADGHIGAVGLLRQHLRQLCKNPPSTADLQRRIRTSCARPGFEPFGFRQAVRSKVVVGWIRPTTIARGDQGQPFRPYHHTVGGLATIALSILEDEASAASLRRLFHSIQHPEVVLNSFPGPLGPVRPIAVNGNHRTLALEALGAPVSLAEFQPYSPPYRCELHDEPDQETVIAFINWLADHGAIRLGSRPRVTTERGLELRIADASAPWLLGPPWRAFEALDAYERLRGRLKVIGGMDTVQMKRTWRKAAREGRQNRPALDAVEIVVPNL